MLDLTDIPVIDLGSVECLNFILLHPKRHVVESEGKAPFLEISRASGQSFSHVGIVSIVCGTPLGILVIAMDVGLVDALSDRLVPGWREPEAACMPFEWRAIVALEKCVQMTPFSSMPCRILNVLRFEHPQDGGGMIFGQVLIDGQKYCVGLAIRNGVLSELEKYLGPPSASPNRTPDDFPVQLQPRIQGPSVSCADIRNLKPGDVLLLPFCHANDLRISLRIGARHSWTGTCDFHGSFTMMNGGTQV